MKVLHSVELYERKFMFRLSVKTFLTLKELEIYFKPIIYLATQFKVLRI